MSKDKEVTKIDKILNILIEFGPIDYFEIARRLENIEEHYVKICLSRLEKRGDIERIEGTYPVIYRAITAKALLFKLHQIMIKKTEFIKDLNSRDKYYLTLIKNKIDEYSSNDLFDSNLPGF